MTESWSNSRNLPNWQEKGILDFFSEYAIMAWRLWRCTQVAEGSGFEIR